MNKESINFQHLREQLSPQDIINILGKFNVKCVKDSNSYLIFPTVCHNLNSSNPKLYYYKDSRKFKCYTQCEGTFDIFDLLIKMFGLRGNEISVVDAIKFCGLSPVAQQINLDTVGAQESVNYLYKLLHTSTNIITLEPIDKIYLERFIFDKSALELWTKEGISFDTMLKYNIGYDPIQNCITIPNFDIDGNLLSIRGRYLDEDADAKYKPVIVGKKVLSHPSSMSLYGINITSDAIKRQKQAIIFESEKSVLMMDSYYGEQNCAVATLGKNISMQQIRILRKCGVEEIILAYDRDYTDYLSMDKKRQEYAKIARTMKPYFNVSYLMDLDFNLLQYKDAPIDRGKEAFEKILKNRIYV